MGLKSFIIALIILEAGLFVIRQVGSGFISSFPVVSGISETLAGFSAMLDLFLLAVGALIAILIVVAIFKRGKKPEPVEERQFETREKEPRQEEEEPNETAGEEETEEIK